MGTIQDEAVCIRHWDWSETSQTVSLFTREHGILRGIAKGSKREKSGFSGGLEILTRGEILAIVKPGRSLATLTGWDLLETFPACRAELVRHYSGLYAIDLIHHALAEGDPHPALFEELIQCLGRLGHSTESNNPGAILLGFQWSLLKEIGQAPQLDSDSRTGRPLSRAETYGFDPRTGGVTADPGPGVSGVWRVRSHTVDLLRELDKQPGELGFLPDPVHRANRLLAAYLCECLETEPNSMSPALELLARPLGNHLRS